MGIDLVELVGARVPTEDPAKGLAGNLRVGLARGRVLPDVGRNAVEPLERSTPTAGARPARVDQGLVHVEQHDYRLTHGRARP